ncbi:MAG: hypothetical protein WC464_05960 [Bdellovibrionales bacterium]
MSDKSAITKKLSSANDNGCPWEIREAVLASLADDFREKEEFIDPYIALTLADIGYSAICENHPTACWFCLLSLKEVIPLFPEAHHYPDFVQQVERIFEKFCEPAYRRDYPDYRDLAHDLLAELKYGCKPVPKLLTAARNETGENPALAVKALCRKLKKCPEERTPATALNLLAVAEDNKTLVGVNKHILDILGFMIEDLQIASTEGLDKRLKTMSFDASAFDTETRAAASSMCEKIASLRNNAEKSLHRKKDGQIVHGL